VNANPIDKYMPPARRSEGDRREPGAAGNVLPTLATMLDLEFADGSHKAYPYATLLQASYDPSAGITLSFAAEEVVISGHGLGELYKGITQQRVPRVKAEGSHPLAEQGSGPVVTGIRCGPA